MKEFDLKIKLSPSQVRPVKAWVQKFHKNSAFQFGPVKVQDNTLMLGAYDFPHILAFINESDASEFDVQKLYRDGIEELKRMLARKRAPSVIRYYKQCLDLIDKNDIGDFYRNPSNYAQPESEQQLEFIPMKPELAISR